MSAEGCLHAPWLCDDIVANGRSIRENFAAWFDGSELRTPDGSPMVVYRGDRKTVDVFHADERREFGLFFAAEEERAACYGEAKAYVLQARHVLDLRDAYGLWRKGGEAAVIIDTLFESHYRDQHCDETGDPYTVADVITAIEEGFLWRLDGLGGWTMRAWRDLQRLVHGAGFDAMIVHDDGEGRRKGLDVVVFDAGQVKLAHGNSGLFLVDSGSVSDAPEGVQVLRDRPRW